MSETIREDAKPFLSSTAMSETIREANAHAHMPHSGDFKFLPLLMLLNVDLLVPFVSADINCVMFMSHINCLQ